MRVPPFTAFTCTLLLLVNVNSECVQLQTISVFEAQERLDELLDAVASGEEIVILRHGKPAARMISAVQESITFPDRSELRRSLPPACESACKAIGALRDDER